MDYIDFLKEVATYSWKVIKENLKLWMDKEYKLDDTPVTKTDKQINSLIIEKVNNFYPTHSVMWEEESSIKNQSDYVWVCDPVDWTVPFSSWIPVCTFSLALVYKWEPIAWVIYDPFMNRMLLAEKWKWAFLNWKKISVNNREFIDEKSVLTVENFKAAKFNLSKVDNELTEKSNAKVFKFYSTLYSGIMLSVWELDWLVFPNTTVHDWASLKIIVEEAWWKMTNIYWKEQRYDQDIDWFIASNWKVHDQLLKIVSENLFER